jgi:hypothetical protein
VLRTAGICAIFAPGFFARKFRPDMAASATPGTPDLPEEDVPPPVYEVEEELIERRISSVPVPKDRRGSRGPAPVTPAPAPDAGKKDEK